MLPPIPSDHRVVWTTRVAIRVAVRLVLLTLLVTFAQGSGSGPSTAAPRSAGGNALSMFAGAVLGRDASGRVTAGFDRDHASYRVVRLPDGAVTISDIQSRRFTDLRVRDVAVLLFGDGWSYDVAAGDWKDNSATAAPTTTATAVPTTTATAVPATSGRSLRICPGPDANCDAISLAEGLRRATAESVVILAPGTYREAGVLTAHGVTLRAEAGARVVGVAAEGKAALVIRGNGTVIEDLDCSAIAVPDRNGACIRLEGRNLTVRRVHFHDAEQGMLIGDQGGTVVIEDSRFERLGAIGRAHGVYANHIQELIIRRSCFLSSRDEGHEVKSRAARTVIENSVIASFDGFDSRLVDVPNGGELIIRNSVLEKGPLSSNHDVIGFGLEGISYPVNSAHLENSIVIIDHPSARLINGSVPVTLSGVRVIGGNRREASSAEWLPDRQAAGLASYAAAVETLAEARETLLKLPQEAMAICLRKTVEAGAGKNRAGGASSTPRGRS